MLLFNIDKFNQFYLFLTRSSSDRFLWYISYSAPSFVRPLSSLGLVKNVTQSAETLCNKHVFLQKDIHCSTVQFCFLLFPVFAPYKVVIFEPFHILFEFELRIYTILFGYNICPVMLVTIWWYFKTIATLKYEDGKVQTGTAVDAANCRGSPYSSPHRANKEESTHVFDATAHWARRRPRRDENGRKMGREFLCSCPVE